MAKQLDADLKKLLTKQDAQEALTEMQMSAAEFEKQAGSLNEKYSSGCKALTESTLIINASKKPLSIDNIPLDDIETAFESETGASEGCSSLSTPAPPLSS